MNTGRGGTEEERERANTGLVIPLTLDDKSMTRKNIGMAQCFKVDSDIRYKFKKFMIFGFITNKISM